MDMDADTLKTLVVDALEDLKGQQVSVVDVRRKTAITDYMIIASGTSDRHVRSLAEHVVEKAKRVGIKPLGIEGEPGSDWVLVDLCDVVVHVMLPRIRDFYNLEKLWSMDTAAETIRAQH